jgi:mono/diheme cytochrome c family protein
MYDKFWLADTTFSQADTAKYNKSSDFFRCKQCHGWDLLGRAGGYANRAPSATRPNVANVDLFKTSLESTTEIFHLIKTGDDSTKRRAVAADLTTYDPASSSTIGDQMPNYGAIFSDKQIWDYVKFLKNECFDVKQLYDFTITGAYPTATVTYSNIGKDGNANTGNTFYTTSCKPCHGADGKSKSDGSAFLVDGGAYSVGSHVRAKPYEGAHIIKYGVLGLTMKNRTVSLQQVKDLFKALSDTTKYPNP